MDKSPDAFRTISEVADWLGVPTHVLRFWESRFSQVKPVKRAGGRRYYRPADMLLLGGIKRLLHDDGLTIRGVQKMLREDGVRHVSSFSQPLDSLGPMRDVSEDVTEDVPPSPMAVDVEPDPVDNVVALGAAADEEAASDAAGAAPTEASGIAAMDEVSDGGDEPDQESAPPEPAAAQEPVAASEPEQEPEQEPEAAPEPEPEATPDRDDNFPEFSFLRRGAAPPPDATPLPDSTPPPDATPPPRATPQSDLFAASTPEMPAAPQRRPIVVSPHVPTIDAPDDDASTPAVPGMAARLATARLRPDHAAIARVVADLRALRAQL